MPSKVEQMEMFAEYECYHCGAPCSASYCSEECLEKDFPMKTENTLNSLEEKVTAWASDRRLINPSNVPFQMMKVIEELGELNAAISKMMPTEEVKSELGDVFVTLIILSRQIGIDPAHALNATYTKISKRSGSTVNGVFVKEEDL